MPQLPSHTHPSEWEKRGCSVVPGVPRSVSGATQSGAVGTLSCEDHKLLIPLSQNLVMLFAFA